MQALPIPLGHVHPASLLQIARFRRRLEGNVHRVIPCNATNADIFSTETPPFENASAKPIVIDKLRARALATPDRSRAALLVMSVPQRA